MKELLKILTIIICTFLAICQINNAVYSYTLEEVKEEINFQMVEDDTNLHYDLRVNGDEMNGNEELPCIKNGIEYVLYSKDNLLNIDFFGIFESESGEALEFITNIAKSFFKTFLYIGMIAMLTVLIYIAVILIASTISKKASFMPLAKVFSGGNEKSIEKYTKEKKIIEQWITSVIILIMIIYVINLVIGFSYMVTEISDKGKVEDEKIVVYVKDAEIDSDSDIAEMAGVIFLPDGIWCCPVNIGTISSPFGARTDPFTGKISGHEGIDIAVDEGTDVYAALDGKVLEARDSESMGKAVIIDHGDGIVTKYMHNSELQVKAGDEVKKGHRIALSGNTGKSTGPHLHFQVEKYFDSNYASNIWGAKKELIDPQAIEYGNGPLSAVGMLASLGPIQMEYSTKISYTFETTLEGLLMFLSQRDWNGNTLSNIANLTTGFIITIFKWFLYLVFLLRMFFMLVLTAFAPIIVLINAFMKVNGNKGILEIWFKLYIYLAILRPVIAILYYILASSNIYVVSEYPFFMLLVILIMTIFIIFIVRGILKTIKNVRKTNMVKKSS